MELALRKEVTEGCSSDSSHSRKAERQVQQVSVGARTRTRTFSIFWGLFSFIIMSKTLITAVRSGGRVNGKGKSQIQGGVWEQVSGVTDMKEG